MREARTAARAFEWTATFTDSLPTQQLAHPPGDVPLERPGTKPDTPQVRELFHERVLPDLNAYVAVSLYQVPAERQSDEA